MNYAINVLEEDLENQERLLSNCVTDVMKKVYKSDIDDLKLAIHNLKMLE